MTVSPLGTRWRDSVRRIVPLAWPMLVGQLAVLAFSTIDTLLVARHSALDLAALAVGAASYITIFIGLMGVVMALAPIVGQCYGGGRLHEAGHQLHQAVWIALALSLVGCTLLAFPAPFLALAHADAALQPRIRAYLAEKPRGKFGVHKYTPEEWGFTPEELRRSLAGYIAHFDIELED